MHKIELIEALVSLRKQFLESGDFDLAARCKLVMEKLITSLEELS